MTEHRQDYNHQQNTITKIAVRLPWYLIAILLRKQTDRSNHVLNIFLSIGPVAIS